jgi:hypothetical protein
MTFTASAGPLVNMFSEGAEFISPLQAFREFVPELGTCVAERIQPIMCSSDSWYSEIILLSTAVFGLGWCD